MTTTDALARIQAKLEEIVIPDGVDSGVILLSWDSPTTYNPELKAHVYKHEHFSPLGDALVELHRMVVDARRESGECVPEVPEMGK